VVCNAVLHIPVDKIGALRDTLSVELWCGVWRCGVVCGVWCGVWSCGVVWCGVVWCGVERA
jgi:hypothetical protein